MTIGRRKATEAELFIVLLVALAVVVVPPPVARATVTLTITMSDALAFDPNSFFAAPGDAVSLTLINAGALTHTFTLFAQANANVPVSDFNALQDYYNANTKLVDMSFGGGQEASASFTAPMTEGTYTFVCMVPGHAASGMLGTMMVTSAPLTESLRVGSVLPFTGVLDTFGLSMRDAADLAADEINSAGVLGGSLELLHRDSQTDPAAGVAAANDLVFVEGVPAIIGAALSSVSEPVAGVTVPNEVVQISPSSTSPIFSTLESQEPGWFWRTAASDALQGKIAASRAGEAGWTTAGLFVSNTPFADGIAKAFRDNFTGGGGTVVAQVNYALGQTDYTTDLQLLAIAAPQVVFFVGFPADGLTIMLNWWDNRLDPGWGWQWLWYEGLRSQSFIDSLRAMPGVDFRGVEGTAQVLEGPHLATFKAKYTNAYGVEPNPFAAHTYDALYLIALAAVAGQGADSVAIRDNLIAVANLPGTVIGPGPEEFERAVCILGAGGNINYEGASSLVNFDVVGDAGSSLEIWQINQDYEIVQADLITETTIWPPSGITSPDATSPTLSISSPSSGALVATRDVVVSWSASDEESGLDYFEVRLDGGAPGCLPSTASSHSFSNVEEGPHTLTVTAFDLAGNSQVASVDVSVDTTKPTVAIGSPAEGAALPTTSVTVTGTASDDIGLDKVEVSITGTTWVLATGTTSWSGTVTLAEGPNTIFARATDTASNTATATLAVTVDTVRPTADAGEDQTATPGATVSFDASSSSDNVAIISYEWDFGDETTGTGQTATHIYTDPGTFTATLTVSDAAGNTDTDSLTVTVEAPFQISPSVVTFGAIGVIAAGAAVAALLFLRSRGKGKGEG